jgi:hypothetical protein
MARGGILLLTVPAFECLWTSHDDLNHHHARYTRRELIRLVSEAGFETLESRYFFHWLVLPKWLIAWTERVLGRRVHDPATPPCILNRFLHTLSRVEQVALRPLGWLPGTSILLTATPRK